MRYRATYRTASCIPLAALHDGSPSLHFGGRRLGIMVEIDNIATPYNILQIKDWLDMQATFFYSRKMKYLQLLGLWQIWQWSGTYKEII